MTPDRNATNFGINSVACKTFAANQIDCIEPILTETQGLCVEIITTATLVLIVLHLTDPNAVECWYVNTSYRVGKQNVCISNRALRTILTPPLLARLEGFYE